jgi:hypothetical protein
MKLHHTMKWVAFLALATVAVAGQDAVTMRRELKPGTTETYKIENEIKQLIDVPSMGEQDLLITTVATVSIKTTAVNAQKGTADVETTTKVEKTAMDGSLAAIVGGNQDAKLPEPKTEIGTMDTRNRLVITPPKDKPKNAGAGGPMAMMGMGGMANMGAQMLLLVELPEKPLKIGDSIEVLVPGAASAGTMGVKDLKMTLKLIGEREQEGQMLWVVNYAGTMKLGMDNSKDPKAADQGPMGSMKMSGKAVLTGEGLIDKASGKTVSNSMTINNDVKVFIEQAGMEIPVKGTIKLKMSLVK